MSQKRLFLFIILAVLIIIPTGQASAAQYYVGVTIGSSQAPGYPSGTDTNWCLPNWTRLTIQDSSGNNLTAIAPTSNPVTLNYVACPGQTVWSGLFNLNSSTNYRAFIDLPVYNAVGGTNSVGYQGAYYCPGFFNGWNTCMVAWEAQAGKNCVDTCAHYGLTPNLYGGYMWNIETNGIIGCPAESFLMGSPCSDPPTQNANYNFYDPSSKACYCSQNPQSPDLGGTAAIEGEVRVCACNIVTVSGDHSFTFPFTAP